MANFFPVPPSPRKVYAYLERGREFAETVLATYRNPSNPEVSARVRRWAWKDHSGRHAQFFVETKTSGIAWRQALVTKDEDQAVESAISFCSAEVA